MIPKVWNKRDPDLPYWAIYVGRPSKWGNPFRMHKESDRLTVVKQFETWILNLANVTLLEQIKKELKGKDLVCWCAPKPCHADILLKIANDS